MLQINSYYCDGILRCTNTTYRYIIANDHFYDTPPNMVEMSLAIPIKQCSNIAILLIVYGSRIDDLATLYTHHMLCDSCTQSMRECPKMARAL